MLSAENLAIIESEGRRILEIARQAPDVPVPQYPDWTMSDLVSHTASICGRTTQVCLTLPQERISAPRLPEGRDAIDWYSETLATMIDALRDADAAVEVWGFGPDPTIGFWERRMVIETGLHRWDAQQAVEPPDPLLDPVAIAGLDEFAEMWLPRMGELPTLEVLATDQDRSWIFGSGEPVESVDGGASDLYLRLMARPGVDLPPQWTAAIDGLAPPPKR